jgi:serine protease DegQ
MRKLWLIFAQATTVALATLLVVSTLRPDLFTLRQDAAGLVTIRESREKPSLEVAGSTSRLDSYRLAVQKALPAVVSISTSKEVKIARNPLLDDPIFRRFFGDQVENERQQALGSGVIVGIEGYILTNDHVVSGADEIEVSLYDGRRANAKVVGTDPESDLAVLKVALDKVPAITFGKLDQVNVGDVVLAIGNPFGFGQTVTMGIVSGLGRRGLGINTFENFIQTDAAINQGNSGGALVDTGGNLIGVNTAILSRSGGSMGIGFAIPVSEARQVMEQIIATGSVTRGWVGVEVQDLTPELVESFRLVDASGVLIANVVDGGPAQRAGVKAGDVLVEVAGKPVGDTSTMLNIVAAVQPGNTATLKLLRNGRPMTLKLTVGKRPTPQYVRDE